MSAALAPIALWGRPELIARTLFDTVLEPRLRLRASRAWRHWRNRGGLARAERLIADILPALPPRPARPHRPPGRSNTSTGPRAMWWSRRSGRRAVPGAVVLKLPHTPAGDQPGHQSAVLAQLHANQALGDWRALLPTPVRRTKSRGSPTSPRPHSPGTTGRLARPPHARQAAVPFGHLRDSSRFTSIPPAASHGRPVMWRWVDVPAQELRRLLERVGGRRAGPELHAALVGQAMCVAGSTATSGRATCSSPTISTTLTGIVDWDLAEPAELPDARHAESIDGDAADREGGVGSGISCGPA